MKLSNKVRWILVLPTSVLVFLAGCFVSYKFRSDDVGVIVWGISALLTAIMVAPLHGKRFLTIAASLFILTCLIPPWQNTADRNGNSGYHSRTAAGYALLFYPPTNPNTTLGHGVQIDFGRLFIEWAALAGITGLVWMLLGKPTWSRDDKADPSQKFSPPTGNPKN